MMTTVGKLPEDLVLAAWREWLVKFWRCLQKCTTARVHRCRHETVGFDLGGQTSLRIQHTRNFNRGCMQENARRRIRERFNELYQLLNCSLQCHFSMLRWRLFSWCQWVDVTKGDHWSCDTTTSAEHISTERPRDQFTSNFRRWSPDVWRRQSWHIGQEHGRNSRRFPH